MKELIIKAIDELVESERLMDSLSGVIIQLGGDFWESKYSQAYKYHSDLVFSLCTKEAKDFDNEENKSAAQDLFFECIFQLAHGNVVDIDIKENGDVIRIATPEDIYNYFTNL